MAWMSRAVLSLLGDSITLLQHRSTWDKVILVNPILISFIIFINDFCRKKSFSPLTSSLAYRDMLDAAWILCFSMVSIVTVNSMS